MFSISKLILFVCLYLSAMSNAAYDAAFIREVVQGTIVEDYINCATLVVLVYDTSKPSLIYANLSDSEPVLTLDKEVRQQVVQLWDIPYLQERSRRTTSGYSVSTSFMRLSCNP